MGEILRVLEVADSWVGAKEPDKRYQAIMKEFEKTGEKYDGQGCYEFCVACVIKALGVTKAKKLVPFVSYTKAAVNKWPGGLTRKPLIGSFVFIDTDGDGIADHTELLIGRSGDILKTEDGNSYHTVIKRQRSLLDKNIIGFGNVKYSVDKKSLNNDFVQAAIDTICIKYGSKGAVVLWLQETLHILGYYNGYFDSWAGTVLVDAITAYQRANGLYVDGECAKFMLSHLLK